MGLYLLGELLGPLFRFLGSFCEFSFRFGIDFMPREEKSSHRGEGDDRRQEQHKNHFERLHGQQF